MISRCALLQPKKFPFDFLYYSGSYQAMITLTGFYRKIFRDMLKQIWWYNIKYTWYSKECRMMLCCRPDTRRPRKFSELKCLALFLAWNRTRCQIETFCIVIGVTASLALLFIRFVKLLVYKYFVQEIRLFHGFPTTKKFNSFKILSIRCNPCIYEMYWVCDGLKIKLENSADFSTQNML